MRLKSSYLILLFIWLAPAIPAFAQKSAKDSMTLRKHIADSIRNAKEREMEIARKARQKSTDSVHKARQEEIEAANAIRKQRADSSAAARKEIMEANRIAREHFLDSAKQSRQHIMDSTKLVRQQHMDSVHEVQQKRAAQLAAIRKYKESKHYKDSVARAQIVKANALKAKHKAYTDSLTASRKIFADSISHSRAIIIAAVHEKQKHRMDSLARIKKYKESKHYADSVNVFKKAKADAIAKARKQRLDSMTTARKHFTDSLTKARKQFTDSIAVVRKHRLDSLKDSRKKHTDSLLAARTKRENKIKADQKKEEQKKQLAIDLKIKKQHEAWSNEKMLKKKWTWKRKVTQNTFTRYNYYFNADKKMDEALANMQRINKENYDQQIELYPFNPDRDSTVLASDMDSILRKVSVGIQIHDPRTKWEDDMYLLMGQAQYYKGHYEDAATVFRYIIAMDEQRKKKQATDKKQTVSKDMSIVQKDKKSFWDFMKHKPVHNEAILWLAHTYTRARQPERAESVLGLLEADTNLPKNIVGKLALERAFLALSEHNDKEASKQLAIAADDNYLQYWQRERAAFLNGQLLQQHGEYTSSAESFQKVLDLHPKIDMDFYARKYLAFNTMYAGNDNTTAQVLLKNVLNDNKYATYHEQVYAILGLMAARDNDDAAAIDYLNKGLHLPKTTKKQKAISFAVLGNVYYNTGDYISAKHAYDSSAKFAGSAPGDSVVILAISRSKALEDVTGPAGTLHDQDSLLALAMLDAKEQRTAVRKYIRHLEDEKRDSAFRAESVSITSVAAAEPVDEAASTWYFANPTVMQQGVNEFKRKWGNRPNVDNWRRTAALTFASTSSSTSQNKEEETTEVDENGLPTEDFLLAAIPNTPQEQEKAYKLIQTSYVELADAYINRLEDYDLATRTLDTLNKRFPSHDQQARVLYLRYIIALRKHNFEEAKELSRQLQDEHGNSEYAKKVKPTEDNAGIQGPAGVTVAVFYDETYDMLMKRQYTDVIMHVQQAQKIYKDNKYSQRFQLMQAMALVGSSDYAQADTVLNTFFASKPPDTLRQIGETIKNYISRVRLAPTTAPSTKEEENTTANVNDMNKALTKGNNVMNEGNNPNAGKNDTSKILNNNNPNAGQNKSGYVYSPEVVHYLVVALPTLDQRTMGIKAAVSDFNVFKYSQAALITNIDMLSPQQTLLVVKPFKNQKDAWEYMGALRATSSIFREYKQPEYQVFIISAQNYIQLFADHSITSYLSFYKLNYK